MIFKAISDIWSAFRAFDSQAVLFGLGAGFIFSIVTISSNLIKISRQKPHHSVFKILCGIVFATLLGIYMSYVIFLTLSGREAGSRSIYLSLIPGATIFTGQGISIYSVENFLLFFPLGFLCPVIWKYFRKILRIGILSFCICSSIEVLQLITGRGFFEIDDIILNTAGAVAGYITFACFYFSLLALKKRTIIDLYAKKKVPVKLAAIYERYILSSEWALILLQLIPVVFMINMILGFSSDTGSVSRSFSRPVAFVFARIMALFSPKAAGSVVDIDNIDALMSSQSLFLDLIEKIIRKLAHVTEYGLLAFCIWVLLYSRPYIKKYISYISAIMVVLIVGLFDEINQMHIEGRFGSYIDVGIDLIGALIAIVLAYFLAGHITRVYRTRIESRLPSPEDEMEE